MMKNLLVFLLISSLQLMSLEGVKMISGLQKNYRADRKCVGRHYNLSYSLNTDKEWKGLNKETAVMKGLKSNQLESEADLLNEKEENRGKEEENQSQGAAAYRTLQSELPRARRSPGLNATFDDANGRAEVGKSRPNLKYIIDARNAEGFTPLYLAVTNDHADIADSFLQAGADLQQTFFAEHRNLLHEAARKEAVNSMHWLVKAGISVNATDDNKWTPLHYAAFLGRLNATKTLIQLKSCIDCESSEGHTAILNSLENDHTAIAALLEESGADVQQKLYSDHRTLLHMAAAFNAVNSIHWLVEKGLSINATDDDKWTPLHYAANNGRMNATKTLIELKSCINCKCSEDYTAIRNALVNGHTAIADLLADSGADLQQKLYADRRNLLHEISRFGKVNSIHWLVKKGLHANASDENNWTPLHYAAYNGRLNATKTLINLKCCIDCKSNRGNTALQNAVVKNHPTIAAVLVDSGAKLQQELYSDHRTLLHEATAFGAISSIRWLVKKGLSINATDNNKWTPLHYAAYYGKLNTTMSLIKLKCCIDCKSFEGHTALQNAVVKDHTNIAALLMESGADVEQRLFDDHRTLLHEAAGYDAFNTLYWLEKKGLSINATDDKQRTPLHYAAWKGRLNATMTLVELKSCINCKSSDGDTPLHYAEMQHHKDIAAFLKLNGATYN